MIKSGPFKLEIFMGFLLSFGLVFSLLQVQDPESLTPVELEKAIDKAITEGAE